MGLSSRASRFAPQKTARPRWPDDPVGGPGLCARPRPISGRRVEPVVSGKSVPPPIETAPGPFSSLSLIAWLRGRPDPTGPLRPESLHSFRSWPQVADVGAAAARSATSSPARAMPNRKGVPRGPCAASAGGGLRPGEVVRGVRDGEGWAAGRQDPRSSQLRKSRGQLPTCPTALQPGIHCGNGAQSDRPRRP